MLALEWEDLIKVIRSSRISLLANEDVLQWAFNKHTGIVTAKLAYKALESKEAIYIVANFNNIIWFPYCPLKQILFF